jgi:hypothetical protein
VGNRENRDAALWLRAMSVIVANPRPRPRPAFDSLLASTLDPPRWTETAQSANVQHLNDSDGFVSLAGRV